MSAKPSLLIILRSPERIRAQYFNGISQAFPDITVNAVSNVKDADPYLAGDLAGMKNVVRAAR